MRSASFFGLRLDVPVASGSLRPDAPLEPVAPVAADSARAAPGDEAWSAPLGDPPFVDAPCGDPPFEDAPFGDSPFGDPPFADAPFGDPPRPAFWPWAAGSRRGRRRLRRLELRRRSPGGAVGAALDPAAASAVADA